MAGATYRDFADLIAAGERIEILARAGKLPTDQTESKKGPQSKKRESEVNLIQPQSNFIPQHPQSNPRHPTPLYNPNPCFPYQNLPPFPKLSISNADLFQRLFDAHLISDNPVRPMEPPFPAWYNPNLTCKFHMGVAGHSIEDCEAFKTAVRKLIACGRLDIQEERGPNIVNNPIPNHERGNQANAVEKEEVLIKKVLSLRTTYGANIRRA
ncbi:hypothetical protein SESBI_26598 [Sesbania bispinosa]|nr:hypothetical protein SESBI_26598 [Sesbania bispinosa]